MMSPSFVQHVQQVQHDRLVAFGKTFHKRFGLFTFGASGLQKAEFRDVESFSNDAIFETVTGSPIVEMIKKTEFHKSSVKLKHILSGLWFNGHLLCDTTDPWRPRAAHALVEMFSQVFLPKHITLVVNPRDFPWCKANATVPWTFMNHWLPAEFVQVSMQRPLSFYGGAEWLDILIPLPEHWDVWNQTKPLRSISRSTDCAVGVFRGTLTGRFMDERNVRINVCSQSRLHPGLLDAKLSAWTNRSRVTSFVDGILDVEDPPAPMEEYMGPALSMEQQAKHKVLVYAPGHVASSRLAWQLCSGSAVLMVNDSSCLAPSMWFMTTGFDARVARFVDDSFRITPLTIAFSCDPENVLLALDWLRLHPDETDMVTNNCLAWAKITFDQENVKHSLQKACERVVLHTVQTLQ